MPNRKSKSGSRNKQDEIFEQNSQNQQRNQQQNSIQRNQKKKQLQYSYEQQQQGQIIDHSSSSIDQEYQNQKNIVIQNFNNNVENQQLFNDNSSEQDNDRLQKQIKKREEFWKNKKQKNQQIQAQRPLTQSQKLQIAFAAIQKSNKKVILMRKKNQKRMQDLEKIRMAQQPYLGTNNTHFRGSASEYSIITTENSGRSYLHDNHSFRVGEMRLQSFILKNIKEQSTANYLNQVVKFQNYAYQQRKKRRHNIQ